MDDNTQEKEFVKPEVQLSGQDGNVFSIIGRVSKALKRAGHPEKAKEWSDRAMSGDYDYDGIIGNLVFEYADVY